MKNFLLSPFYESLKAAACHEDFQKDKSLWNSGELFKSRWSIEVIIMKFNWTAKANGFITPADSLNYVLNLYQVPLKDESNADVSFSVASLSLFIPFARACFVIIYCFLDY